MPLIELCKGHNGASIFLNSRWREDDSRMDRVVTVTGYDEKRNKVQMNGRTWANPARFGKRGGYLEVK